MSLVVHCAHLPCACTSPHELTMVTALCMCSHSICTAPFNAAACSAPCCHPVCNLAAHALPQEHCVSTETSYRLHKHCISLCHMHEQEHSEVCARYP